MLDEERNEVKVLKKKHVAGVKVGLYTLQGLYVLCTKVLCSRCGLWCLLSQLFHCFLFYLFAIVNFWSTDVSV